MRTMRGLVTGVAGGVLGTALLVAVLVLVFGFGSAEKQTVVRTEAVPASFAPGEGLTPAEIYRQLSGGVVMVLATFGNAGQFGQTAQGLGTGFVTSTDGYILTNAHVVSENGQTADEVTVVFKGDGTERVEATLVGVDNDSDVALIKVDPDGLDLEPLPLGDSDAVTVGESVVAIGNPLGYDFSLTSGIVSATGRSLRSPSGAVIPNGIQTDAAINQGNSGGPLIDAEGKVIGINEQIATETGGNDGLGFAVPINTAKRVMEQLKKSGEVRYAWLGIGGQTLTPDVAQMFDVSVASGAMIEQVAEGSPADQAGLQGGDQTVTVQGQQYVIGGDVITAIDGTEVATFDDLIEFLTTKQPGDSVTLTVARGDETTRIEVTLGDRPASM
jgi:S1-C subfamily serine protease